MTEDTWGLLRVCPGAEVRQGGRKRQGGRATHVGEAEQSCALLELCSFAGLLVATGVNRGHMD